MASSFADFKIAAGMRDVITQIVRSEVNRIRPESRIAQVKSINEGNLTCEVSFAGDTGSVNARFGLSLMPKDTTAIVRVAGTAGNYYITEIVNQAGGNALYEPVAAAYDAGELGSGPDGLPPSTAPVLTATAGLGSLILKWTDVANPDFTRYAVHVGSTAGVATDGSALYALTPGTSLVVTALPNGTPLANGTTYFAKVVPIDDDGPGPASNEASATPKLIATIDFGPGSVNEAAIAAGAVTNVKIFNTAVDVTKLADGSVSAVKVLDAAIGTTKMIDSSVLTAKLADLNITLQKVANLAIDTSKLGALAVDTSKLAALAVDTSKLGALAVDSTKIANLTITSGKVGNDALTSGQIATDAIAASELAANSVLAGDVALNAITANELAANSITATDMLANTVTASQVAVDTLTAGTIAADAIAASELAANSITAADMLANTVTATQVAVDTLTAGNIAADAIAASELAANSITATDMLANTVTVNQVAVDTLTANAIAANAIAASEILANAVVAGKINANVVTATELAANSITASDVLADTMTVNEIAANAITVSELAASSVVAGDLTSNAVTAGNVAALAITAGAIASNAVTAGTVAADAITATHIDAFAITSKHTITGAIFTGGVFRTADSGQRIVITNDVAGGQIKGYSGDSAETVPVKIDPSIIGTGGFRRNRLFLSSGGFGGGIASVEIRSGSSDTTIAPLVYLNAASQIDGATTINGTTTINASLFGRAINCAAGYGGFTDSDMAGGGITGASINNNGHIYRTGSQRALKRNIRPLTLAEARKALGMESYSFQWRKHMEAGDDRQGGFIAEQAEEAGATLWVSHDENNVPTGIRYGELTSAHNVLIKDLLARIERLEGAR